MGVATHYESWTDEAGDGFILCDRSVKSTVDGKEVTVTDRWESGPCNFDSVLEATVKVGGEIVKAISVEASEGRYIISL
jgi:hypothetical protein